MLGSHFSSPENTKTTLSILSLVLSLAPLLMIPAADHSADGWAWNVLSLRPLVVSPIINRTPTGSLDVGASAADFRKTKEVDKETNDGQGLGLSVAAVSASQSPIRLPLTGTLVPATSSPPVAVNGVSQHACWLRDLGVLAMVSAPSWRLMPNRPR